MVVDVGRKIIHPVGEMDDLGIGVLFTHLLDSAVDIAAMWLQPFYDLSLEGNDQPQNPVGGRVLRTHIDMVFLLLNFLTGCE